MTNIEFIYFDVGGVIVLDFSKTNKWNEVIADWCIKEKDLERLNNRFDEEERKFDASEKDCETFVDVLRDEFDINLPPEYSLMEDFVNRFQANTKLHEMIFQLKNQYKLGLLTNMYMRMLDTLGNHNLLPDIKWDVIVDSSKVGFQKPEKEIYEYATKQANVDPEKILFIENTQKNLDAASELGWQTFLYDPSNVDDSNKRLLEYLKNN